MFLSETTLILASGFWLTLFIGCVMFAVIAIKSRRQLSDLDRIIDTQRGHIQKLSSSVPELQVDDVNSDSVNGDLLQAQQYADELKQQIEDMDELQKSQSLNRDSELTEAIDKLAETEEGLLASESLADSLQKEVVILEQQVKTLSDILDVGDLATMREIIVNFTEETRGLLATITDLEVERNQLLQQLEDTESNEKGTIGTVVGLKRKLSLAEQQIKDLKIEHGSQITEQTSEG
ncbi:MAG: hypothetical protein HOH29_07920 [Cellvibrionales bacterium]|jgi:hypothetical protein|nr:hypothetical protein [Cellvibrionales bacterium]